MESFDAKHALGGRWAAHPAMWLVLFGPASVLVIIQETTTPFRTWWALPASALAQHLVAGIVIMVLITVARGFLRMVPLTVVVVVWLLAGAARGAVSAGMVDAFSSAEPQYGYRILVWIVISGVWMPLAVYTATQIDRRSRLLSSLITLRSDIEVEYAEAEISEIEREQRLFTAVRAAIAPVIIEIRQSLELALAESKRPLVAISDRIETVVGTVRDIIVLEPIGAAPRMTAPRHLLAPLSAAITFDRSRPIFASTLVAAAAAALLVPEALRTGGAREAIDMSLAIVTGAAVMAALLLLLNSTRDRFTTRTWHLSIIMFVSASCAVTVVLLTSSFPLNVTDVVRLVTLPLFLVTSSAVLSSSVGLSLANQDVVPEEVRLNEELAELRARAAAREEATREQFTALMHGPVLGRLSACVMALNFHVSAGGATAASRAEVAAQVISHLDLVMQDLEEMTTLQESDTPSR